MHKVQSELKEGFLLMSWWQGYINAAQITRSIAQISQIVFAF
jgi:hypothetical protein